MDLHGAPGSQNGFDNSGRRGDIHFHEGENPQRASKVLGQMSMLLKSWIDAGLIKAETIAGVELLNEPFGFFEPVWEICRDVFYYDGYQHIRSVFDDPEVQVAVQTGFRDFAEFDEYMQPPVST